MYITQNLVKQLYLEFHTHIKFYVELNNKYIKSKVKADNKTTHFWLAHIIDTTCSSCCELSFKCKVYPFLHKYVLVLNIQIY